VIAVMKLRIFDMSLSVIDVKSDGFEKPKKANKLCDGRVRG